MRIVTATAEILQQRGRELRAMRVRLGITAEDIAQVLGVSAKRVRDVERMRRPTSTFTARYEAAVLAILRSKGA